MGLPTLAPTHCKILFSISCFFKLLIKPKLDIVPKANWKKVGGGQLKDTDIKQRTKLIQFGVNDKGSIFFENRIFLWLKFCRFKTAN